MWRKQILILLTVVLVHSALSARSNTNQGIYHLDCPVDDDPYNPTTLPLQGDCTKFIKCSYGKAYTLSCPRGLYWSEDLNRCESKTVAQCDPDATTPRPVVGAGCSFTYKPHPTDCDKAIQCVNGQETILYCLRDMFWDQSSESCSFDDSHCA